MSRLGYLDCCNRLNVSGWACDTDNSNPLSVDVFVDGIKIASLVASLYREDLGAFRNGFAAFHCTPFYHLDTASHFIEARFSDSGVLLKNGQAEIPPVFSPEPLESITSNNPWNNDAPYSYQDSWSGANSYVEHLNYQITGEKSLHWLNYVMQKYILVENTLEKRLLILGANEGRIERELCRNGFLGQIVATDIADKALQRAEEQSQQLGYRNVRYLRADLNSHKFDEKFDFIVAEGVLHHIENLEHCINSLSECLNPGGLLIAIEFTGAYRFQLSDLQYRWINAALGTVPRKLRPVPQNDGSMLPPSLLEQTMIHYVRPTVEHMLAFDPSEAVSGFKLPDVIRSRFLMVEEKPVGGSLLMYMSGHFPLSEANTDRFVDEWLGVLIHIEEALNKTGILPYENLFFVAKKAA